MAIRIECPECRASYSVSDEMAGRTIRCKECDARVDVPDDDEPVRSRRRRERGGSNTTTIILCVVGGVSLLACIACSGIGIVTYMAARKAGEVINEIDQQMNVGVVAPSNGKIILNRQDVLRPNDPMRDGRPQKLVPINLQQGKTYVFDLRSTEMDTYLIIYDPGNFRLVEDDDSGGGLNSRIRMTAARTGQHQIGCTAFAGIPPNGARFTLTVHEE